MKRFVIEGDGTKKLAQWLRTSFVDDGDQIYLPVAAFSAICRAVGGMTPQDSVELHNIPLVITVSGGAALLDAEGKHVDAFKFKNMTDHDSTEVFRE